MFAQRFELLNVGVVVVAVVDTVLIGFVAKFEVVVVVVVVAAHVVVVAVVVVVAAAVVIVVVVVASIYYYSVLCKFPLFK